MEIFVLRHFLYTSGVDTPRSEKSPT